MSAREEAASPSYRPPGTIPAPKNTHGTGDKTVIQALAMLAIQTLDQAAGRVRSFLRREDAQDAFEYMLIVGGVSVAVVIAVVAIGAASPRLRTMTCSAIATITSYSTFSC